MQRDELRLALEADICQNSARKALRKGPKSLRGRAGQRAEEAMQRLGLLPVNAGPSSDPPPQAA
ncbi:hypothetical protein AKJ09_11221 [Labilithrix luteola]|uniref:Uncharacterized protein n=1 Tax=Labilithrix luteola TaxID=1391654 RepID=A0A0K1QFQ7_9BACT|nr:hypothetical protein [Labilithrix luteola]AKV04558.1 hypothetical protein AKJ09_11221 [Labilithrix luteola]